MGLRISNNIEAVNTHRNLTHTSSRLAKSMEKLSSGFRINRASDDAAGLAISERMRGQIRGLEQAQRNAQDAIGYVNTAEGALGEVANMLQRIRELAVQYASGTTDVNGRIAISTEAQALGAEITRTINNTTWNGVSVLNAAPAVTVQVGANQAETMTIAAANATTIMTTLNVNALFPLAGTAGTANITTIETAITAVSTLRSAFGASANRLEYTVSSLGIAQENMMAAESRIRDVDMAQEMVTLSKLQILQESGVAMLAQANQSKSAVLKLLG
jgi:flagellin